MGLYLKSSKNSILFRLAPKIDLDRFFKLGEVERGLGTLAITLFDLEDKNAGSFKLLFADRPLQLKQWVLKDTVGTTVKISLLDIERDTELDEKLFIVDPDLFNRDEDK